MKPDLKKIFKKNPLRLLFLKKGGEDSMDPVRDWSIGLGIATCGFIAGVSFIGFDFYTQMKQEPEAVVIEVKPINYKERDVMRYAELFAERAQTLNKLREQKAVVPPEVKTESVSTTVVETQLEPLAVPAEEQYTEPVPTLAP